MEEDIRKKGMLYVQQQRFGKKWRKVWSILYRESSCSISRLEFFECKDGGTGTLEKSKCKQDTKKIIRLSDCVRVSEAADVDGCPKDCKAFLIETTEKTFVFAVEMVEVEDWMQKLCEIAFPMNWSERGATKRNSLPLDSDDVSMTDNSLYGGKEADNITPVSAVCEDCLLISHRVTHPAVSVAAAPTSTPRHRPLGSLLTFHANRFVVKGYHRN
ncbi:docking protein 2 [Tachysurus ichikawai]